MKRKVISLTAGLALLTVFGVRPAAGQQTKAPVSSGLFSGWEVEGHAGAAWTKASDGGLSLPNPGPGFLTFNGLQSRQVPSWLFGDGAALLNQHLAAAGFTPRITPLDSILNASSVASGEPYGVRVTRGLTARVGVEFALDMLGSRALTADARRATNTTRASFVSAWTALTDTQVSSSITSDVNVASDGLEVLATGALTVTLRSSGRLTPYAVIGGGVWSTIGTPQFTVEGGYLFLSGGLTPFWQNDEVSVKFRSGTSFATLLGGGVRYALNDRSGLRFDFRGHFAPDPTEVVVNWQPTTFPGIPANTMVFAGTPAIQVSNTTLMSTLSLTQGDPDYVIAAADGMRKVFNFTIGYYYRF